jgi:eukaryotic-like serine/threonine-protein kinase
MSFQVGEIFGDYSITAPLGGGATQLYKVEHCLTGRTEIMKVLASGPANDVQIKRFEREMRALARLNHPNIASLHNALYSENQLILSMEYIEGQTLESVFASGRLPLDAGISYVKQILAALGYAHQQGVVHRDVTPANVMVTGTSQIKLTDFGLSKSYGDPLLTNCGEVLGSLGYLAPEQLKGVTQPDRRSDLYSVGAILYEHLTGQKPFGPNRRLAPVLTDSEKEPQPPSQVEGSLPGQWDDVIRRALARDPAHRYQTAEEFLDALAQIEQSAAPDLPLPRLRKLAFAIAIFAGLLLAGVASPALKGFWHPTPRIAPRRQLHIAPPDFAINTTPHRVETAALPTRPRLFKPRQLKPAKPATRAIVAISPPAASAATVAQTASSAPPAAIASPTQQADNPVAPEAPEPAAAQETPAPKKGFWGKLNVFKKKNADSKENLR